VIRLLVYALALVSEIRTRAALAQLNEMELDVLYARAKTRLWEKIEQLRNDWFAAPDQPAQAAIGAQIQQQAPVTVPYIPTGQYLQPTAYRSNLEGVPNGFAIFWNVKKA